MRVSSSAYEISSWSPESLNTDSVLCFLNTHTLQCSFSFFEPSLMARLLLACSRTECKNHMVRNERLYYTVMPASIINVCVCILQFDLIHTHIYIYHIRSIACIYNCLYRSRYGCVVNKFTSQPSGFAFSLAVYASHLVQTTTKS